MSEKAETAPVSKAPSDGRPSLDRSSPRDSSLEAPRLRAEDYSTQQPMSEESGE